MKKSKPLTLAERRAINKAFVEMPELSEVAHRVAQIYFEEQEHSQGGHHHDILGNKINTAHFLASTSSAKSASH